MEREGFFRVASEKKLDAEIFELEILLQKNFIHPGLNNWRELRNALFMLESCLSNRDAYRGFLEGHKIAHHGLELELGHDHARFFLLIYLFAHPKADNKELVRYLDRKNGRLKELRTNLNSPFWAWLPRTMEEKFKKSGFEIIRGESWETALKRFPNPTMQYLSRVKKMAKVNSVKDALIHWPRIIREHSKERSRK